ncbi:MAG: rod shape-determining protein MreD [Salinisphaeraceae bacterium]|jgi:rod shape-determining protein MreD|nr:rod shape-determining protein MreD [Salinisphaeraceae bacterium]
MNLDWTQGWLPIVTSLIVALFLQLLPLPETLSMARPAFFCITLVFWTLAQPDKGGILLAWIGGLFLDACLATPFGQHGLALSLACFVTISLRGLLRDFPTPQQSMLLLPAFAAYEFVLFWVDGVTGRPVGVLWRVLPALSTAMIWPLWVLALEFTSGYRVIPRHSD